MGFETTCFTGRAKEPNVTILRICCMYIEFVLARAVASTLETDVVHPILNHSSCIHVDFLHQSYGDYRWVKTKKCTAARWCFHSSDHLGKRSPNPLPSHDRPKVLPNLLEEDTDEPDHEGEAFYNDLFQVCFGYLIVG